MAKSSTASANKTLLLTLLIILTFIALTYNLPFIFKKSFLEAKTNIEKGIGYTLNKKVSIEKIEFIPYGELKLDNINIYDEENMLWAKAKDISLKFKLLPFLVNKNLIITELAIDEPIFLLPDKNLKIIIDKNITFKDYKLQTAKNFIIKIKAAEAVFAKDRSDLTPNKVYFDFWAREEEENKFYCEGWANLKDCRLNNDLWNKIFSIPLQKINYKLKTSFGKEAITFDELLLDFGQFKVTANGRIQDYNSSPVLNINFGLNEFYLGKEINLPLRVNNLSCALKLSENELLIKDLSFFLNNFPIGLKGKLYNFDSPSLELKVISYPNQIPALRPFNPLNFEFNFYGHKYKNENSFGGKLKVRIDKLISSQPLLTHTIKFSTNNLVCKFLNKAGPETTKSKNFLVEAENIIFEQYNKNQYLKLNISSLSSFLSLQEKEIYLSDFSLSAYDGFLKGHGSLDFKKLPPKLFFDFEYNSLNLSKLTKLFQTEGELSGDLSGKGVVDSGSPTYFSGEINMVNGLVKNLTLLNSISDFLNVKSIKNIYFDSFSSHFSLAAQDKISLNNIRLRGKDVYLDANLDFKQKEKLEGDIMVRFSTRVLKESVKLRMLFFLIGNKLPYADFEFKVAGLISAPHLQWLDGKFKSYLLRYLSRGSKEMLEKKLEEAIKPLLENK